MLAWLVRSALQQRVIVLVLAAILVVLGLRASTDVPLDVFPEFAPPIVEIQTEAPGKGSVRSRYGLLPCRQKVIAATGATLRAPVERG
ncbi:efflux RND transporter permease subunit [Sphingobium yanoikuyae]|uniref:efflux RND transporter permease subunit n=1 Tax=Sphingobium yanoikuyae TaxID=13690 RepID=UPI0030B88F63